VVPGSFANIISDAIPTAEHISDGTYCSVRYENTSNLQNSITNLSSNGYESINFHFPANPSPYSELMQHEDYDYDEVYFEPASEVEELLLQLGNLSVPTISNDELK